ncbi:MAG TPA: hypothetical protein VGN17_05115 [Bryobacteraceae bacterium]|jgi:hypothetical protein
MSERLSIKELAFALGGKKPKSRDFILSMRHQGFPMPDRKATEDEARAWLAARPHFRIRPRKRVNRKRR